MKFLSVLPSLLVCLSASSALSQADYGPTDVQVTEQQDTGNHVLDQQTLYNLTARLCTLVTHHRTKEREQIKDNLDDALHRYLGLDPANEQNLEDLAKIWNINSPGVICPSTGGLYPPQHFYKRAIHMGMSREFLNEYFLSDHINFPIDVNAIEFNHKNEQVTVLDFIDEMIALPDARTRFNLGAIIRLKKVFEQRYNGKRAHEMSPEELGRRSNAYRDLYPFRTPQVNARLLPAVDESPVRCEQDGLDEIQDKVADVYEWLGSNMAIWTQTKKLVKDPTKSIEPSEITCYAHPEFGRVFRQTIAIKRPPNLNVRPSEPHNIVYWRKLAGDKDITFDIF